MFPSRKKEQTFQDKLVATTAPEKKKATSRENDVARGMETYADPQQLYRFQNPSNFSYRGTAVAPGPAARSVRVRGEKRAADDMDQPVHTLSDDRDVELMRMIQRASQRPKFSDDDKKVAPNDELLISHLQTAEDAIAFFSSPRGASSTVKYVLLNRAPRGMDFKPYDLVVVRKGNENREHYIMSATGVVHVCPGRPSEVITLADWLKDSALFNALRKIPFFRRYLISKAFARMIRIARHRKYAKTRKTLSEDFLFAKRTFSAPAAELMRTADGLSTVPMVFYEPQGKHDYVLSDFTKQQVSQREEAASRFGTIVEKMEAQLLKLGDILRERADVPDLNTREALQQYLLACAQTNEERVTGGKSRKTKSMYDAKIEQLERMKELKRSMVEYTKMSVLLRLADFLVAQNLCQNVLDASQHLVNVLRTQGTDDLRKIGFLVLLQPTDDNMLFAPTMEMVQAACMSVFTGCNTAASSIYRLCDQKSFLEFFQMAPQRWNLSAALERDSRLAYLRDSTMQLIAMDYDQANVRMETYRTTLPHIHFLRQEWPDIEAKWKEQAGEEVLSCLSLAKLYHRLQEASDMLRVLMASQVGHCLWVNAGKLRTDVEPRMGIIRAGIDDALRNNATQTIRELHAFFRQKTQLLSERPTAMREFADYIANYQAIMAELPRIEATVTQAESLCDLMDRQQVEFLHDEDKQLRERTLGGHTAASNAMSLQVVCEEARHDAEEMMEQKLPGHIRTLEAETSAVVDECQGVLQILSGDEFATLTDDTAPVIQYLDDIEVKLGEVDTVRAQLTRVSQLFGQPPPDWSIAGEARELYALRSETWSLLTTFNMEVARWFDAPLTDLKTAEVEEAVNAMMRRAAGANRSALEKHRDDELAPHLMAELQALRSSMPIIHDCGNPHMTPDHWDRVLAHLGDSTYCYHDGMTLRTLESRGVFELKEVLSEESGLATGEWRIGNDLAVIKQVWDGVHFTTIPYKDREGVVILDALEEVIQQLDDHQIELQTIMASRFVVPVQDRVEQWIREIRLIAEVIEEWITLQKNWMYLEFIFSSDDIKEQLPEESAQFAEVDALFRSLTGKAHTIKNVRQICTEMGTLEAIQEANAAIDHIQKKLEEYLETKRIAFPRFYFLSNDELLAILSDVRNPKAVQPHLSKCFDSIAALLFADEETCEEIVGMRSAEGETVSFDRPVFPVGGVEQWLSEIEQTMKSSLHMHLQETVEAYPQRVREEWFFDYPAQCVQAADMVYWTGEVEQAIDQKALGPYRTSYQAQLLRMVELVKTSLSKLQRTLVCTLIVLDVHNRDTVETLIADSVETLNDFTWSRQMRYHWEEEQIIVSMKRPNGAVVKEAKNRMNLGIRHCSAHLWYGYEYLGNQPRLVITPLTDRAFLTCTSALAMNLGAAPQGPAGTGKTESVKDLGKALARQVVVFNCSDGINYKTMSRMFAGLAQAGAWACFDEFNRIELEVLSVIAQQMLEITTALGQKLTNMNFDGHPITLSRNFGVFITMNPGYAGRTELPDNLKALFRPICMMIPDYALIAEIMFYSEGFMDARTLAQKMVQLYKLSSEQLSKQDHYDFGMRAVKSILVMAGALKRNNPDESEDVLLIRAMRNANVPKFLRDDTVLFMALVKDLFPTVEIAESRHELLERYMTAEMTKRGLQVVDGMVLKSQQLFDTLEVRHGVMMVGQTYTGKSTIVETVRAALTQIKADGHDPEGHTPLFNRVATHVLNPKSVTMGELYGQVNEITREWTDGILSDIARTVTRLAQTSPDRQWVIFDGPVDAIWIENMNTVLDDNKLLCLFNGERIKLPQTATFMFEVQDLRVASPATVSRCGMVFTEPYYFDGDRGWVPIAASLVASKAAANPSMRAPRLLELLNQLLPEALKFIRTHCREWLPTVDAQLAVSCIELLDSFLASATDTDIWPAAAVLTEAEQAAAAAAAEADAVPDFMAAFGGGADGPAAAYDPPERFQRPAITAPVAADAAAASPDGPRKGEAAETAAAAAREGKLFDLYFIMAFVWSVGGNLRDDSRAAFSTFLKEKLAAALPELGPVVQGMASDARSVYDYVVHRPSLTLITWDHLVPDFTFDARLPYFDLVVPTAESVALQTLLAALTARSRSVLVNGVTGTGKSLGVMNFMRDRLKGDDPTSAWESFSMVLSAQTLSRDIEDRLETKLMKLRSNVVGPSHGKRAIFFVDDLNMPALEVYGASPPIELLRQLMTQGGFFDKHKTPASFKELHDTVFLAACGVPGGGRNDVTTRLTSRFHMLCLTAVSDSASERIFGSILYGFLRQWRDEQGEPTEELLGLSFMLVEAARTCYQRIVAEKLPTPTRSHYTFNLRDLSKVIQGVMQATPMSAPGKDDLCRLFLHEVTRVFHDRLIDDEDRAWWWQTLEEVAADKLEMPWKPSYRQLLFGDYMRRDRAQYLEVSNEEDETLLQAFAEYEDGYNLEFNRGSQLIFFSDAIGHITRICRILRQPRGNALLVGMGGTGRQSLCRLAAFICDMPVHELSITRTFSMSEFHESMKAVLLDGGCHDKPVVFFLSDAQIVYEAMLEDVNSLLNTGEIPNLMQTEDVDHIVETVRPLAAAAGKPETRAVIQSHFVSLCRDHVHVVLAMSPIGEQFRRRLRMFPSLVNCCTIDWFDQWPSDALHAVAQRALKAIQMSDEIKDKLVELFVSIHTDVQASSETFYNELRRRTYTTPTSYLELLSCYTALLQEQDAFVTSQIERYQKGLDTLSSTQTMVDDMKVKLVAMQPKLLEAAKETEAIMKRVEEEQESAEVVRQQCASEEAAAGAIQGEADGIRAECQVELDKAMPILKAAEDALAELRPDDIREVRSFQKPAARVILVLEAVLTLLGEKDVSWDRAKLVMGRMDFIKDLQNFPKDDLTERMIRSIQKYIKNPEFQPDEVAKSSKACRSLAIWVLAINNYFDVVKVVAPKRARLAEAEGKVAAATETLKEAQGRLQAIEDKLSGLQREMEGNVKKKRVLEDDIELTTVRLGRAEQLMSGLRSEQTRWVQAITTLTAERGGLVGRTALAAGFVAYLGPFTAPYREGMLSRWSSICDELEIPVGNDGFTLGSIMDPVQIRAWAQQGLPPDPFSVENGVVVTKSKRWCLCIDPQGQAANWVRAKEKNNNLRIIKLSDAGYMRALENSIRLGLPVLIENVEESLDAALDSILLRQTYRSQGRLLIRLGDVEVDYDPNFRLYITTKLTNPHYLPELQIKVTVLNFTVTQAGLENQLLADVVRYECAELEQRADETVLEIARGKDELKALEAKILELLASSTGNILDNLQLVQTLQEAKATSEAVTTSLQVAEETQKDIEAARNRYRPVATRGATIYSVISELAGLDHMYQNSLDFFKTLFLQTLRRTETREDVDERVALLLPAVTLDAYMTICRGLFEKDKLTFAFLLFAHIARQEGRIMDVEWSFLLKGSEGRAYVDQEAEPSPMWLPAAAWNEAAALTTLLPDTFGFLKDDMYDHEEEWEAWYATKDAYEVLPASASALSPWHRLLVLRALREDVVAHGLSLVIRDGLGPAFTESPAFDLEGCFAASSPTAPIIFVLTPGTDPTQLFTEFADRQGFSGNRRLMLSLGQDQGTKAEEMIRTARAEGLWVYLQNCHVYASWMPQLEHIVEGLAADAEVHADFRLWLTTMPISTFPVLLLQSGVKVVKEPPTGLKANVRDTLAMNITPDIWASRPDNAPTWRRLLLALTYFHAVVQERRKFGPLGWNIPYEWNQSDLAASLESLSTYISHDASAPIPWDALRYMVGVINYGGRVTDFLDSRSLTTLLTKFFNEDVTTSGTAYNITADGVYSIPAEVRSLDAVRDYVSELPAFESPELFGLHPNADITCNRSAVRRQLAAILSVQPRTSAEAGAASPEEKVLQIVQEFESRLPAPIDRSVSHADTYRLTEDGTMISLGTVAMQEIDVFNAIVAKVGRTLVQLRRGIRGEVVMSAELEAMFESFLLAQVPKVWHDGGYLSRKPLAAWFADTLARVEFFRRWNDEGPPSSYWISGFFFPQGFLTGVLQTHSRAHRIPIDDVKFRTNVTGCLYPEEVLDDEGEIETGVYIHGLFMEGARYDVNHKGLRESMPGELYTSMPVIHLEPVRRAVETATAETYACPVYKTCARVGTLSTTGLSTNFVVTLDMPPARGEPVNPRHWIERGVALLCMLDD